MSLALFVLPASPLDTEHICALTLLIQSELILQEAIQDIGFHIGSCFKLKDIALLDTFSGRIFHAEFNGMVRFLTR
jgi:hypothetical protein